MALHPTWTRRRFLGTTALGAGAGWAAGVSELVRAESGSGQRVPLKIGIRAASIGMVGDFNVIRAAARIPGIMGVELQTTAGRPNLRDWDAVRRYKKEADRWAIRIPSLAGVWDPGVKIHSPNAGRSLIQSIRAAEMLGAGVILAAFFRKDAPDMAREASYGPVVQMLQKTAPHAADAGVVIGLENSLSPADNKKLVDLVDHPAVRVYYDVDNMAFYGHGDQAIPGIALLGKERICAVHVKNGKRLLSEPGRIDWAAAFEQFNAIGYAGWYVYETAHDGLADCIEDTKKNNAFLRTQVRMPVGWAGQAHRYLLARATHRLAGNGEARFRASRCIGQTVSTQQERRLPETDLGRTSACGKPCFQRSNAWAPRVQRLEYS